MPSTYLRAALGIGILSAALAACGGDGDTTGTGASTSSGGSGGTTSSTTAGGGTTTSAGGGGSGGTTTTSAGGGGAGGTTTTSEGGGGSGGTTTTSTTGPTYGFCAKPCGSAGDCCPSDPNNEDNCPSDTYPDNPVCTNGACYPAECATTADCTQFNPKHDCLPVGGFNSCKFPCDGDEDCVLPLQCLGATDDGGKYCRAPAGMGCANDDACMGLGKCVNAACVCEEDTDCTYLEYTKCSL